MNHECFQVLHPWAYELDSVDFKYIVNNNLNEAINSSLHDTESIVFWLTFFKSQKSAAADEFFEALRQLCEINKIQNYYLTKQIHFEQIMNNCDYVISIEEHAQIISDLIQEFVNESINQTGYCSLQHQLKLYFTTFEGTNYIDETAINDQYKYDMNARMEYFKDDPYLGQLTLKDMSGKDLNTPSVMQRKEMNLTPEVIPEKRLKLRFESVDTEELKNVEINFEGDKAVFKIGEGEANHYQIPNDKKLWETQFMIINIKG